jgi:hypothetical protein
MPAETIDHRTLSRLVEAGAVRGAHVVGQPGGWSVLVKYGMAERALAAQRSRQVRVFRRMETLVNYLKGIGIQCFDVDGAEYEAEGGTTHSRPDRAEALRHAHEAAAHDRWFRARSGSRPCACCMARRNGRLWKKPTSGRHDIGQRSHAPFMGSGHMCTVLVMTF